MAGLYLVSIAVILIIFYLAYRKNSIEEAPVYHKPVDTSYYKNVKFPSSYVALDVETTGFDVNNDRIIEIALIRVKDNVIDFEYSSFVNPERPIPERITELTGISDYNMMSAISNSKMVQDVISVSQGLPFIAHNADFDIGFLSNAFKREGLSNYRFHSYDTQLLSKNAFPGMPNYKLKTLNQQLRLTNSSQMHRAISDANMANVLYRRCVEVLSSNNSTLSSKPKAIYFHERQAENNLSYHETEYEIPDEKKYDIISHAPKPSQINGYSNLTLFKVSGRKKSTNRLNHRNIWASSDTAAKKKAIYEEGLMEPLQIEATIPDGIVDACRIEPETGIMLPPGASSWDEWEFRISMTSGDYLHIPKGFMEYATQFEIPLSWLGGRDFAARKVFSKLDVKEQIRLYGYSVHCSLNGSLPGNYLDSPNSEIYTVFADFAINNPKITKSISGRSGDDIWHPSKETIGYKYAVNYFKNKAPELGTK